MKRFLFGLLLTALAGIVLIGVLALAGGKMSGAPAVILVIVVIGLLAAGSHVTGIWSGFGDS